MVLPKFLTMSKNRSPRFLVQLIVLTLSRLVLNTSLRMMYPFLPELARGLQVPLEKMAQLVALRSMSSFLAPVLSPLSERFGRRPVLAGSMVLLGLGCLVVVIRPGYWPLAVTLIAIGIAKVAFDPAMHAYLGDTVPYAQRGKAISVTEFAWAGSLLVGVPAIGFVISRQGWAGPFLWLAICALAASFFLWRAIPAGRPAGNGATNFRQMWQLIRQNPVIWAAILNSLLIMTGHELLLIVYGDWMETTFTLSLTSLGLVSAIIGGSEISGELLAGWSVDRFGKRPIVIVTGILTGIFCFTLPYTGHNLTLTLLNLFGLFMMFEINVVGGIPLLTEIVPEGRSVVMAMVMAAAGLGRTLGDLVGPKVWEWNGIAGNSWAAGIVIWLGVFVLARWIRERSHVIVLGTD